MATRQRLARRPEDGMLAGVAAGVAAAYDIDVTLVRLGFIAAGVLSAGAALVAYVIAAVVMPREDDAPGIDSLRRGVDDLVTRGRELYDETRRAIDRPVGAARGAAEPGRGDRPGVTDDSAPTSNPLDRGM